MSGKSTNVQRKQRIDRHWETERYRAENTERKRQTLSDRYCKKYVKREKQRERNGEEIEEKYKENRKRHVEVEKKQRQRGRNLEKK